MLSLIQSIQEEEGGADIRDFGGIILQRAINSILQAEISSFLSSYPQACRNGYSSKKVKSNQGMLDINTPRDRDNEFEPRVISKHQREINGEIESKIISLYAHGMSYSDISNQTEALYGLDVSTSLIHFHYR